MYGEYGKKYESALKEGKPYCQWGFFIVLLHPAFYGLTINKLCGNVVILTIKILMQLDKQSLLLIDSGARLLAARQDMDSQRDKQLQEV